MDTFFYFFWIEVRSTRIRGRKKRHVNLKSAFLAISGQNGYIFSSFFDCHAVSIKNVLENEHLKFEKRTFGDFWSKWVHFFKFFDCHAVSIENVLENEHLKFEKCVFG